MGNDGGSIQKRSDLVKEAKADRQKELQDQLNAKDVLNKCALSGKDLMDPIVSDYRGKLYNKDTILEWLLDRDSFGKAEQSRVSHITSIGDVVELKITRDDKGQWSCPIASTSSGPYVYLVECGHVFSSGAMKALMGYDDKQCPECSTAFDYANLTRINPTAEQLTQQEERIKQLQSKGLSHSLKKKKDRKKRKKVAKEDKASEDSDILKKARRLVNDADIGTVTI